MLPVQMDKSLACSEIFSLNALSAEGFEKRGKISLITPDISCEVMKVRKP